MKSKFKVWFDRDKNHVSNPIFKGTLVEKDNYVFRDTLTYDGWHSGRSSAVIHWKDSNGVIYESGMKFLDEILIFTQFGTDVKEFGADNRLKITATFTFRKYGPAVMLAFYDGPKD